MATYNVTAKVIVGDVNNIGTQIAAYLNTVDNTKVIRGMVAAQYGTRILVVIVHDA
jgi:protein involved in ribonucleotide reduction